MWRYSKRISIVVMLMLIVGIGGFASQPSQAQSDVSWTALFFPSTDFTGSSQLVSYPSGLSVSWGLGSPTDPATSLPLSGIPADNFSVRFSANATIPAGTYDFTVVADGGVRLSINNNVIIDAISNAGATTQTGSFTATGGTSLLILDYVEYGGTALVQITWQASGTGETQATEIPTDIAEAEVFRVDGLALRSGPYLGASLVAVLRPGITYTVVAQSNAEDGVTWYRVLNSPTGQTGWASGRFLEVDLRPNSSFTCSVSAEQALSIVQQSNTTVVDANTALQCVNSVISATNGFSQTDEISALEVVAIGNACSAVLGNQSPEQVLSFAGSVQSTLTTGETCTENNTPTISLPEESTIFETLASLPDTEAFAYPRSIMNMRVRPSIRVGTLGQIPWGAEANLLARTVQAGDDHWYLIRYNGIVAWVDASFVNVSGNMATVPIY